MEKQGHIEIHITGNKGNNELSPENFDIREIKSLLDSVEDLLYPGNKKGRPDISYRIESGSVRNIFKTSMQAVVTFSAVMSFVSHENSIDSLELPTAIAIEKIQDIARKSNYVFDFKTSNDKDCILSISPETNFHRTTNIWVNAELYYYGILTNAGGKDKSNIHIDTPIGTLIIATDKEMLEKEEKNLLYKYFGVRVAGRQNLETGEIDKSNLKLIELIDYNPTFEEDYINKLISKVGDKFDGIDVDNWITEIRGGNG